MNWLAFVGVWLPIICFISGIILLGYSVWRKKKQLPCLKIVVLAIILLFVAIAPTIILMLAAMLGLGPVPN